MWTRVVTVLVVASIASPANACSVCGCGDPLLSASDPAAAAGVLRFGAEAEWLSMSAANEDDPARTDHLDQYTLRISAVYSPTDRWSFLVVVPVARKDLRTDGITSSDLTGLADLEASARLVLLDRTDFARQRRQSLAVSAGTSLPTGRRAGPEGGVAVDEHGQLGTGAWGPFAGLHFRWEQATWTAFASVTGRVRTTNAESYHYGDALLWSIHGQYWVTERLALDLGLDGRYAGADTRGGDPVPSTGGTVLAAAPGVYWNVWAGLWASARAQLPFVSDLEGRQSVGPTIAVGVQYQLF